MEVWVMNLDLGNPKLVLVLTGPPPAAAATANLAGNSRWSSSSSLLSPNSRDGKLGLRISWIRRDAFLHFKNVSFSAKMILRFKGYIVLWYTKCKKLPLSLAGTRRWYSWEVEGGRMWDKIIRHWWRWCIWWACTSRSSQHFHPHQSFVELRRH